MLLPEQAGRFIAVRVAFEVPILLTVAALWWRPLGARWPEQLAFLILALPELAIAWMIPRSQPHLEAYLLGFSLAIYDTAFLVVQLRRLSHEDDLTGVANVRAWEAWLDDAIRRSRRSASPLSVIYCDFDRFKDVNDHFGHAVGDDVLQTGASVLTGRARATDFVARLGGDEFVVGCPNTTVAGAAELAEELASLARRTVWPPGVTMTFSFGVTELQPEETSAETLLARADEALYAAKTERDSVATDGRLPRR